MDAQDELFVEGFDSFFLWISVKEEEGVIRGDWIISIQGSQFGAESLIPTH